MSFLFGRKIQTIEQHIHPRGLLIVAGSHEGLSNLKLSLSGEVLVFGQLGLIDSERRVEHIIKAGDRQSGRRRSRDRSPELEQQDPASQDHLGTFDECVRPRRWPWSKHGASGNTRTYRRAPAPSPRPERLQRGAYSKTSRRGSSRRAARIRVRGLHPRKFRLTPASWLSLQ